MAAAQPAFAPLAPNFEHLTSAQRRFLQVLTGQPDGSLAQICKSAEVTTRSYYAWCQDPAFRRLTTQIWSQAFLANGWQVINHIANFIGNSASYARILTQLLFDPKGQAALAAWSTLNMPALAVPPLDSPLVAPAANTQPEPTPAPGRVAAFLKKTIAKAERQAVNDARASFTVAEPLQAPRQSIEQAVSADKKAPASVKTPVEQNQPLTPQNFLNPEVDSPVPQPEGALSADGLPLPAIEARTPSDQQERLGQKVAPTASRLINYVHPTLKTDDGKPAVFLLDPDFDLPYGSPR
ncbi:MAG: hypothetical protein ACRD0Y_02705 [Terriglobales bacterium]